MTLSEDALNRIKSEVFEREKAAYAFDGKPLQWQQGFTKAFDEAFKAAYSPEVLQALGVEVVPISEPNEVAALKAALNFNLTDANRYRTLRDEALHFSFEDSARETAWIVLGTDCKDCHPTFMGNEIDDVVDAMIEAIKEQS